MPPMKVFCESCTFQRNTKCSLWNHNGDTKSHYCDSQTLANVLLVVLYSDIERNFDYLFHSSSQCTCKRTCGRALYKYGDLMHAGFERTQVPEARRKAECFWALVKCSFKFPSAINLHKARWQVLKVIFWGKHLYDQRPQSNHTAKRCSLLMHLICLLNEKKHCEREIHGYFQALLVVNQN